MGTENNPDPLPGADDPVIITDQVPDAFIRTLYTQALVAARGTPPWTWRLTSVSPELAWLTLDVSSGQLSGVPNQAFDRAHPFKVRVVDASGRAAEKEFHLQVRSCLEGELLPSYRPGQGACHRCAVTCGATTDSCQSTEPSEDPAHCGPLCGACASNTNLCSDGRCACGETGSDCGALSCCGGAGDPKTARCVDVLRDVNNCGGCGQACARKQPRNAVSEACSDGHCRFRCSTGFGDCNGNLNSPNQPDGCETPLDTVDHCGSCGARCASRANAVADCKTGKCQWSCRPGFADCDGDLNSPNTSNGCESDLNSVDHCGACSTPCAPRNNATPICQAGQCRWTCNSGFGDCNRDLERAGSNGCESDLNTPLNCHECGRACPLPRHGDAACEPAGCTKSCPAETAFGCDGAACCPFPSNAHVAGPVCSFIPDGPPIPVCSLSCEPGWGDCDFNLTNGCETNLHDPENCGSCGAVCPEGAPLCDGMNCQPIPPLEPGE